MQVEAATYYVSPQGNDGNSGTSAQPFRTISYAYSKAVAGTTIIVMPGTYTDYRTGWGLRLGSSGAAASPIVLRSQVPGAAIIDGQYKSDRNVGFYIDGNYNVVDGFDVRNSPNGGITIWSSNNRIQNCVIHHNGNPASSSTQGKDGIYSDSGTSGNVYTANYIHHNGRTGGNASLDHGLYLCGQNELVNNNVLLANAGSGLQVAGYTTVRNLKVYNNIMAYNGYNGIILWMALSGVDIKNNIFFKNGRYAINTYDAHGGGVVMDRNISYGNGVGHFALREGNSDFAYTQGTSVYSNPLLANDAANSFDCRLTGGSPGILAGHNLTSIFTTDMAGAARQSSGSWDLGPYLYGAAAAPGHPPITVSIAKVTGGMKLTWNSVAGRIYKIAYRNHLAAAWTDLSSAITAAGASSTWTDTGLAGVTQRFYRVSVSN